MSIKEFNRRKRERERMKSMLIQKIAGILVILLGIFVAYIASKGVTPADTDCGGALLLMLLGVGLVFTREQIFV